MLTLNTEKTASVVCNSTASPTDIIFGSKPLPQANIKWGFIILQSDGVFRISQELLEPHIQEMRNCLGKAESVMTWINAHNKYLRFFIRNFGEPALTFGQQHITQILTALQSVFLQVHPEAKGYALTALKLKFPDFFGPNKQLMDSWFYWPIHPSFFGIYPVTRNVQNVGTARRSV